MKINVVYSLPLNHLIKIENGDEVKNKIIKLLYNMLLVNTYLSDDITLYTDFDGMSIFSIISIEKHIIYSKSIDDFNAKMLNIQKKPYLILNDNQFLLPNNGHNERYYYFSGDKTVLNLNMVNTNVSVGYINNYLHEMLGDIYVKFLNRINEKINTYDKRYNKK